MPKKQAEKKRPSPVELDPHLPMEGAGRNEMIQIYAWNFEDAWKAQEEWRANKGNKKGLGPLLRYANAMRLKELYEIYKTGNIHAIIEAVAVCSLFSLPIPFWCAKAFREGYTKVGYYEAQSWEDVFGRAHPKGTHLSAKKDEIKKMAAIYKRVSEIKAKNPETPIDESFFEVIGKEYGVCRSLANKYYYKERKRYNRLK